MSLPSDIAARVARIVASGDRKGAGELAGRIAADIANGAAKGFEAELAVLTKIAGAEMLGKRAPTDIPVPDHLRGRYDVTMRKMQTAKTPSDMMEAKHDGEALLADMKVHAGLQAALALPQRMGLAQ